MARIGAFIAGVERTLLRRLAAANAQADLASLRLAAGKRILAPRDEPSTFVALAGLQYQLNLVSATMANATAANALISQAQAAADEVATQLQSIRTELLKDENGNLTPEDRAAAQAVIDSAIDQINSISGSLISGRRLLDGSADYRAVGRNPNQVFDLRVYHKTPGSNPTIAGEVLQAATQGQLVYTGTAGRPAADAVITLTGKRGSATIAVDDAQTLEELAAAINRRSHNTGITASVTGDELTLTSVDYGSGASIGVEVVSGQFEVSGTGQGTDAQAVINGQALTGDGNRFDILQSDLHAQIEFQPGWTGTFDTLSIQGEGLSFSLSTAPARQVAVAIGGLQAIRLGGITGRLDQIASGGAYAGLGNNTSRALRIVDEAIGQIDQLRGALHGFAAAAVNASSSLLTQWDTNLANAVDATDGYDEDTESALLARYEDLAANARAGLAIVAQQRAGIVTLIQKLAGLL